MYMTKAPGGVPRDITVRALRARELQVTWQVSNSEMQEIMQIPQRNLLLLCSMFVFGV